MTRSSPRRALLATAAALALGTLHAPAALAQAAGAYPAKAVTFVVPFAAGSATDQLARALGQSITNDTKQPVVIDNKAGASGMIAASAVAKSAADGYSVLITTNTTHAANEHLYKKLSYDPVKDFAPVTGLGKGGQVLVVNASAPYKSVGELLAFAKKNPGKLNYGSGGVGSMGQLNVEMLKVSTGVFTTHIPYRGGTPLITGVLGNEVQFILDNLVIMLPHIQAGKVRALAVAADQRLPQLPDVPTMAEVGHPELNLTSWTGLAAPAGTPEAVVQTLYKAVRQVATSPAMVTNLKERGVIVPEEMPPAAFEKMMAERLVKFGDVVRKAGITAE